MKKFKIILALLLGFGIAAALCACGEVPEEAGKYKGAGFEIAGVCYEDSSLSKAHIDLGTGGKGILAMEKQSGEIFWRAEGESLSFNIDGNEFSGSLKDGVLKLDMGDGVTAVFLKEGAEMPEGESIELPKEYYGWWRIVNSEGEMPATWIDCCARLSLEEGLMLFDIWDEDGSAEKPMGRAVMGIVEGVPVSQWGDFWYSELSEGQWQLKPQMDEEIGTEVIKLRGEALDRSGGTFSYEIFLRPWGERWDDANKDAVPYFYNSWYLPIVEQDGEMPESFEGIKDPLDDLADEKAEESPKAEKPAEAPAAVRPAETPAAPQITQPAEIGESNQPAPDFNDKEIDGFTDNFEG